jgi:predicted acyltransferase
MMNRDHSIDSFRGIAIIGMVFFTVTLRLSSNLPDILRHNVWGTVHLGDFILPMFLFASGLSLAYFLKKRENEKKNLFLQSIFLRFGKLAMVGISLSIFSACGFLEMDEVMLSAILFITCIALSKLNWKILIIIIFVINSSYVALIFFDMTSIFVGHYLGGYPAALYYLPAMLTGLVIGKGIISKGLWCGSNQTVMWATFIFFLIFLIFIPLNKMTATPSFVMFATLFSFIIFVVMTEINSKITSLKKLESIGRRPLRYWLMMYIVFLIPLWFYVEYSKQTLPLNISWYSGILISFGVLISLYFISHIIEYITISD